MPRFKYDKQEFDIKVSPLYEERDGKYLPDGFMAEVCLLNQPFGYDYIPVVDEKGHTIKQSSAEAAAQEAMRFIVKSWERSKPKPRLPVGTKVYVASRNMVGVVAEPNIDSKYFRIKFPDGASFDIHEKDLTPFR